MSLDTDSESSLERQEIPARVGQYQEMILKVSDAVDRVSRISDRE